MKRTINGQQAYEKCSSLFIIREMKMKTKYGILCSHKNDAIMNFATTWIKLKGIILNEVMQRENEQVLDDITDLWYKRKQHHSLFSVSFSINSTIEQISTDFQY